MSAKELLNARFEVIADYPDNPNELGSVLECPNFDGDDDVKKYWIEPKEKYPHLFRRMNWWEERRAEQMPKKLICKAIPNDTEVMEIEEWDMELLVGWTNKKERQCCSLLTFNPKYGYFPVD